MRIRPLIASCCLALLFTASTLTSGEPPAGFEAALGRITAGELRKDVEFLASDALEGRDTPSAGLDTAAQFIAGQFLDAGLEPAGDDSYFQTADFALATPNATGFKLSVETRDRVLRVPAARAALPPVLDAIDLRSALALEIQPFDLRAFAKLRPSDVEGKVILVSGIGPRRLLERLREAPEPLNPALVVLITQIQHKPAAPSLVDRSTRSGPPVVEVEDRNLARVFDAMQPGDAVRVTYSQAASQQQAVKPRNVAGILRGSDAVLKNTYVLVTAHYDHLGICAKRGDRICHGANDDASGTASVIELAKAFRSLPVKPRRSVLFMTFFGEEKGLLGSMYYAAHPLVPLAQTVADINLEQLGRTDDKDGPQIARVTVTGFDYSDLESTFEEAGRLTGVTLVTVPKRSEPFFDRSDNYSLDEVGVPSHTLAVALEFPDYHSPGDVARKLDYSNMEKVDRMIGLAVLLAADNPQPPKWNTANSKAAPYAEAQRKLAR